MELAVGSLFLTVSVCGVFISSMIFFVMFGNFSGTADFTGFADPSLHWSENLKNKRHWIFQVEELLEGYKNNMNFYTFTWTLYFPLFLSY